MSSVRVARAPLGVPMNSKASSKYCLRFCLLLSVAGEALVAQQAAVVVEERQVSGDVQDEADVQPLHELQVLRVLLVPQEQEGQDGGELRVLDVRRGGQGERYPTGPGQPRRPARVQRLLQVQGVIAQALVVLPEAAQTS